MKNIIKLIFLIIKKNFFPTFMYWDSTYKFTTNFINQRKELEIGLEIGVAGGFHIKSILENTSVKKMFGVDPYLFYGGPEEKAFHNDVKKLFGYKKKDTSLQTMQEAFDKLYKKTRQMLSVYQDRCFLIRKTAEDACEDFKDCSLDFVFIDGAHDYKNAYNDISLYYPKVKTGGYIMGHDFNEKMFPGVVKAVKEYFELEEVLVDSNSTCWYVKKS